MHDLHKNICDALKRNTDTFIKLGANSDALVLLGSGYTFAALNYSSDSLWV